MKKALEVFAVICIVLAVLFFVGPFLISGLANPDLYFFLFPFWSGGFEWVGKAVFIAFGIINVLLALLVLYVVKRIKW
ncbi:hypothetical protein [Aquisalibacillus elongatus]|uniref:YfzA-like protein n=1 Tax=Aquisalibacillus elongatus TaxID=485577 RepID=A0A3N5CAS1_9BACI|nr:hypothetical protein [Aquisalibacillus elongatus]RPF53881.1 hypothetical protein EDC24_1064 [Aquisalibacillus elongatus]